MKHKWLISDAYYGSVSSGAWNTHESICVLNTALQAATVRITLYFEDRDCLHGFVVEIPGERTRHIRMDKLQNAAGQGVPTDVPYAALVESDTDLAVQYTRLDCSQPALALMTAFAYKVQ